MKIRKQGAYINEVRRLGDTKAESSASMVATDFEGSVNIVFDTTNYGILDASWAIHRAADMERRGEGRASMLIGESAYIDDRKNSIRILPDYSRSVDYQLPPGGWIHEVPQHKSSLTEACPDDDHERAEREKDAVSPEWLNIRELFNETIRGAYQAENYMLVERNYADLADYEDHWINGKNAYCRPYNPPKPKLEEWPEHAGTPQHYRMRDLYNKYIHYNVIEHDDGHLEVITTYNDSFHEMTALFTVDPDAVITDMNVMIVRVPFARCREFDHAFREDFVGKCIKGMKKREIGEIVGGAFGCYHLLDAIANAIAGMQDLFS